MNYNNRLLLRETPDYSKNENENNKQLIDSFTQMQYEIKTILCYFVKCLFNEMKDRILRIWSDYPLDTEDDNEYANLYNLIKVVYTSPIQFELSPGPDGYVQLFPSEILLRIPNMLIAYNKSCSELLDILERNAYYIFDRIKEHTYDKKTIWRNCKYNNAIEVSINRKDLITCMITKIMYVGINYWNSSVYENCLHVCCKSIQNLVLYIENQMHLKNNTKTIDYADSIIENCSIDYLCQLNTIIKSQKYFDYINTIKPVEILLQRNRQNKKK